MENNLYRVIFENSPLSLILTNSKGTILDANPSALKLIGYNEKDLINSSIKNLFPFKVVDGNDNNKQPFSSFDDIVNTHKMTNEFLIQKKNGDYFFSELNLTSFIIASTELFIWSVREIFHEKKMIFDLKERVKEQLALLRVTETLFKCSNISTALSECVAHIRNGWQFPEHTVVRIKLNDGTGYTTEGFVETKWGLVSNIQNYGSIEVFYTTEVPMHGDSVFLREENKLIDGLAKLLSIFLDQFHAISKIREKETLIIKITDQIPGNTYQFEIDENGDVKFLFASKGINKFKYGYDAKDLIHNPNTVTDLIHEEDKDRYLQSMKNAYQNPAAGLSIQYRVIVDDSIQWRWLRATPENTDSGKVIWYASSQDITSLIDYINVQEQIIFDISHVIRRPVTTMLGLTNFIEKMDMTEENIRGIVEKLKSVAKEMDDYTKRLNEIYNEKKLSTSEFKIQFQFLNKRIDLFNKPIL